MVGSIKDTIIRPTIAVGGVALFLITVVGIGAFCAYYFGAWPAPDLEVDDPAIEEWLSSEDVIIHRRGFEKHLDNTTMYILDGQRIDGMCRFTVRIHGRPGETRVVARPLATNHRICEQLILEGTRPQ